jgi:hypothetical protein
VGEGGVEALGHEPLPDPLDGPVPAPQGLGYPPVFPVRAVLTLIGQQQHAGAGDGPGRPLPGLDQCPQLLALIGRQGNSVSLSWHGEASYL